MDIYNYIYLDFCFKNTGVLGAKSNQAHTKSSQSQTKPMYCIWYYCRYFVPVLRTKIKGNRLTHTSWYEHQLKALEKGFLAMYGLAMLSCRLFLRLARFVRENAFSTLRSMGSTQSHSFEKTPFRR